MVGWEQERDWRRGSVQSADGGGSSTATAIANQFIARLRVKNDAARLEAAHELFSYVNGELKDNPNSFVEEFLYRFDVKAEQSIIHDMISSNDSGERKAGIFMIVCLIEAYINLGDMSKRVPRFSNYLLKKSLTSTDQSVMELAARAIAYVVITSKTYAAEVVEKSLNQACEWLEEAEPNESRRLAAVLLSRELARCTPTFFFQRATRFFDHVFKVIKDAKPNVREEAVGALRAALVVTSQRETKQQTKTHWYKHCYDEATHCFRHESASPNAPNLQRDDRWHSGLLIINELLRIANADGERMRLEAEELIIDRMRHRKRLATARKTLAPSVISQSGAEDVIDWLTMPTNAMNIESRTGRRLVEQEYANMCKMAMEAQKSRSPSVQHVLLELLPRLAAFDESTLFVEQYLDQSVEYVLGFLNKEREKGRAFLALGLLSLIAKNGIKRYVPRIVQVVRTGLPPPPPTAVKKKAAPPADQSVFICLTLIVRALKHEIEPQIKELLRPMFAGELSVGLTVALREMSKNIPSLRGDIQDGLLEQLSMLLMHKPMPSKLAPPLPPELPSGPVLVPDVNTTVLALETLGQFQFQRHSLQMFIKYIAYGYLNSEMTQVRLAAVQCCCYLLVPFLMLFNRTKDKSQKITLLVMIQEVIGKLLAVAVTDSSKNVRLRVFECLSEPKNPFLSHLAQSEMLELIFMGLHDEEYDIREAAVCLLGQLGEINPAYVMPILRRVVIQILSELNNSGIGRIEEKSARLLAQVACNSPQFMKPYMHMVLKTLIPKLRKDIRHVDATVSVLNAIGELAQVGGPELVEVLDKLVPILIHFLQDTSSLARREAALRTLGQVCQNTGFVVDPYRQYPDLLEVLLRFLKTEHSATMRRETIRVLGILGALDPYTHKVFMGTVQSAATSNTLAVSLPTARDNNDMRQDIIQWFNYERCTLEEFYPAIAIANLMHMIQDPSLVELQMDVVKAVMTIFSKLGSKCVQYVEQVVPRFLTVIRDCRKEGDLKQFFFLQLGTLASIVRQHIKPYLREIFELIGLSWTEDAKIRITIITLLEQVAIALGYEFKPYVPQLCPYMLRVLQHDKSKDKMVTAHVLRTLQAICSSLEEHLHLIIPPIVKIFDDKDATPLIVRQSAINTLYVFATEMSIAVYAPRILHAWLRAMGEEETRPMLVKLLYVLMQQMARKFLVFRPSVDAVLARHRVLDPADRRYEELLHAIEQNTPLNTGADDKKRGSSAASYPIPESSDRKQRCNFELLRKTWLVTQVGSKEDWTQWLVNLRVQLLKHSPYSALKACGSLAEIYEPLARDLFNAAFMSVWTELSEEMQNNLTDSLYEALKTSDHSEIIQTILNLAEFMDHSEKGPLPVQYDKLSECALQTRAYAKALRYKELQIHKAGGPAPADCEALITLTNKLNLQEEAAGVVEYAGRKKITISVSRCEKEKQCRLKTFQMQGRWYEKLHQWEKALDMYEMQQQ
uniref:Serine/threonine-protein kinase TOR n=1 Tax=Plectus sambesii TaxID=2011161 RepID=A0A914W4K3_9BILA